jgi:hypothetical protein
VYPYLVLDHDGVSVESSACKSVKHEIYIWKTANLKAAGLSTPIYKNLHPYVTFGEYVARHNSFIPSKMSSSSRFS